MCRVGAFCNKDETAVDEPVLYVDGTGSTRAELKEDGVIKRHVVLGGLVAAPLVRLRWQKCEQYSSAALTGMLTSMEDTTPTDEQSYTQHNQSANATRLRSGYCALVEGYCSCLSVSEVGTLILGRFHSPLCLPPLTR